MFNTGGGPGAGRSQRRATRGADLETGASITFDEALSHVGTSAEVTVPTCQLIAKAGYKIGDRVVRAAQVLVVDPE